MAAFNYNSLAWRTVRSEKLRDANYTCEACRRNCRRERGRILVHHALGARRYPEFALVDQYLDALCVICHEAVHRAIRFPRLLELAQIGHDPRSFAPSINWGPIPWQFPLGLDEAANDETFTLDPPITVADD